MWIIEIDSIRDVHTAFEKLARAAAASLPRATECSHLVKGYLGTGKLRACFSELSPIPDLCELHTATAI